MMAATAPRFLTYENADNAHARWNTSGVALLGHVHSHLECRALCLKRLGDDATNGCTAYTWYHPGHYRATLSRACYGDQATGYWRPFYSDIGGDPTLYGNVTSGQNDPFAYRTPCSGKADCSYNGKCGGGKTAKNRICECFPQWMGKNCGQLALMPTARDAGLQTKDGRGRVSSWGGSVVRGDDGKYHMYAAEMTNDCGIVVWLSNSRIRHAVSSAGPDGPYEAHDVAEGLWGHEPTAARAPTGEYVLYWTADLSKEVPCTKIPCDHCSNGESTGVLANASHCLPDTQCTYRPPLRSYMSYAKHADGPWSAPQMVPSPPGFPGDTNLAPIIKGDGSLLGLGRPPWIWRAADWRNLSTYTVEKAQSGQTIEGEDPFLYVDPREPTVLHALSHAGGWDSSGGHVWSDDDGVTWSGHSDVAAYSSLIMYDDGTAASLSRRERPHLVFDASGVPVALTNGVTTDWPCTHPEVCPKDYCHTALQRLRQ